jgi:hypothetical protein
MREFHLQSVLGLLQLAWLVQIPKQLEFIEQPDTHVRASGFGIFEQQTRKFLMLIEHLADIVVKAQI